MAKKQNSSEMPFLDHLEELRWRILWSLLAVVVGIIVGFVIVQRFAVLDLLKLPIEPYLPDGKLYITHPTDAFFITFKLAFLLGIILAAPVIVAQLWRFLAPALYEHERKYIVPALFAGTLLFVGGVVMAYLWVFPAALRFLLTNFQEDFLEYIITANEYLGFEVQFLVVFGLAFELPLVMVLMSGIGIIRPETFAKHRAIAILIEAVFAAMVTPADVASMVLMFLPLMLLYEAGILAGRLVSPKANRIAGLIFLLVLCAPQLGNAQDPQPPPGRPDSAQVTQDSLAPQDSLITPIDTAVARDLGLPAQPSRAFPAADSILLALLNRPGYMATRYMGDSITLFGTTREILLNGTALVERESSMLEAGVITFAQSDCRMDATGSPVLFDAGTVLTGEGMRYDTCERIGTVARALTSFNNTGVTWYLRGGLEVDSASVRIYGVENHITSCDLGTPHYHIDANNVKWVNSTIMVARPAVLYVRDVPVLWLPFIFQDMRPGRRSGILVPRFGISDIVRPNSGYQRTVSNIGFYLALSDYTDVQFSLDWFSGNYISLNGQFRYRWLDRFVTGGIAVSRIWEQGIDDNPGDRSLRLQWNHQQSFDRRTRLSANVDYATRASVIERNTTDPFVQTATLGSRANFSKQFDWGTLSAGGSLSQDLSNGGTTMVIPTINLTPRPIDIGSFITWSPAFSFTNSATGGQRPGTPEYTTTPDGGTLVDTTLWSTRNTNLSVATPVRIGRWNWQNSLTVNDRRTTRPPPQLVLPDPSNPNDSITRFYGEDFQTGIDWNTGINLPSVFPGTWKIQPSVGIRNTTGGPFLLRNRFTNGAFVSQGKRLAFNASMSPAFFGFFPGFGPLSRIRHSLSPLVAWNYAPSATVPEDYANAIDPTGIRQSNVSPALQTISLGLSQTFEGKFRQAEGDTTTDPRNARKVKLLSIQTSPFVYNIEQAKQVGRTGFATQTISNQMTSDLLPGFSLAMTHNLWDGPVGFDTTRFDLFLSSVSARFSLSGRTFQAIAAALGGGEVPEPVEPTGRPEEIIEPVTAIGSGLGQSTRLDPFMDRTQAGGIRRGRGLQASVTYDQRRFRQDADVPDAIDQGTQTLGLTLGFSPTPNWSVSWATQYNFNQKNFGQHVVRFDRDLHRWRATFAFTKAPNGNFAFSFFITLTDEPDLKFVYDQRSTN